MVSIDIMEYQYWLILHFACQPGITDAAVPSPG